MKYSVLLNGENFEVELDGKVQNLGFATSRCVKAKNVKEAELKAVALVKSDKELKSMMIENSIYTPMVYVEEISKVKWWKKLGGKGFTFYSMESGGI